MSPDHSLSQNPNAQHSPTRRPQTPSQAQSTVPEQHGLFDSSALDPLSSQVSGCDLLQAHRPENLLHAQPPLPAVEQCDLFSPDDIVLDQGPTSSLGVLTPLDELVHPLLSSHPSPSNPLQSPLPSETLPIANMPVLTTPAPHLQNMALPKTDTITAYSDCTIHCSTSLGEPGVEGQGQVQYPDVGLWAQMEHDSSSPDANRVSPDIQFSPPPVPASTLAVAFAPIFAPHNTNTNFSTIHATTDDSFGKRFPCPMANCRKRYKGANGLKYHLTHSSCCPVGPKDKRCVSEARSTSPASVPSPTPRNGPSTGQGLNGFSGIGIPFRIGKRCSDTYEYPKVDNAVSTQQSTGQRGLDHTQPSSWLPAPHPQRTHHFIQDHPVQQPYWAWHAAPMYLQRYAEYQQLLCWRQAWARSHLYIASTPYPLPTTLVHN